MPSPWVSRAQKLRPSLARISLVIWREYSAMSTPIRDLAAAAAVTQRTGAMMVLVIMQHPLVVANRRRRSLCRDFDGATKEILLEYGQKEKR